MHTQCSIQPHCSLHFAYHDCNSCDDTSDLDSVLGTSQRCARGSVDVFLHHYQVYLYVSAVKVIILRRYSYS